MTDPRPVRQVERRRRGCDGGFRSCSGWNGGHSCYLRWGGLHQLDSFGAKLGGQAAVVAVDEAASLGYLIPSQKGLFEMSPGVRRWSGAEEATGCRLLASPPYLLRSGQA